MEAISEFNQYGAAHFAERLQIDDVTASHMYGFKVGLDILDSASIMVLLFKPLERHPKERATIGFHKSYSSLSGWCFQDSLVHDREAPASLSILRVRPTYWVTTCFHGTVYI